MDNDKQKYLLERYPKLYRQNGLPMTETCMNWGFEIGNGWYDIINKLSEKLEHLNNTKYIDNPVEAVQVKEKYGSLRFYLSGYNDDVHQLVNEAELKSEVTCEECGKPGVARNEHWIRTLCDVCNGNRYK